MTPVALCADDYALSPGVDEGILRLAAAGRITSLSCMTTSPRWADAAAALAPHFGKVEIGLHFTLTQLAPLGPMPRTAPDERFPSMNRLYRRALFGGIDRAEIEAELSRQLDAFVSATGREPDFLDGHHHVHQLPGVREAVAAKWSGRSGWVRNTATTLRRALARRVAVPRSCVLASYGRAAEQSWHQAGIRTNVDFAGVRSFTERAPYRALMQSFLKGASPGLLIMCHPGRPDQELAAVDHVLGPRAEELAYLSGPDFLADLETAKCTLTLLSAGLRGTPSGSG